MSQKVKDFNELSKEAFEERLNVIKTKSNNKYQFLVNAGEALKSCIFKLFKKVWTTEMKPQQSRKTLRVQLYKGENDL